MVRTGYLNFPKADEPIIFGHEICAEVIDHGPQTSKSVKPGTRVCVMPVMRVGADIDMMGLSARTRGAYAERLLADQTMILPVPNGISSDLAALTEPLAVALHAVNRSEIKSRDVAIVVGCGPVGLATICMLKSKGVKTIVASDFSFGRRNLALQCGADVVINPAEQSPYENWQQFGFLGGLPQLLELGVGTREQLGRLPIPWWHSWRLAESLGLKPKRPVIFECVGVPGVLQTIIDGAPLFSRIVVVGVCMQPDQIEPAMCNNKELDFRYTMGYSPLEYRDTLHMIAHGKVNCAQLITGVVGLSGVENAFEALKDPEQHAKILIDPVSAAINPIK